MTSGICGGSTRGAWTALAAKGDCAATLVIVGRLKDAVPGLTFTEDGLEPFIASAKFEQLIAEVRSTCGVARPEGAPR
jgi:hypothetical protein